MRCIFLAYTDIGGGGLALSQFKLIVATAKNKNGNCGVKEASEKSLEAWRRGHCMDIS